MRKTQAVPILDEKTGLVSYMYREISDIELERIQMEVLSEMKKVDEMIFYSMYMMMIFFIFQQKDLLLALDGGRM
jgi:hypothetical protein